MDSALILQLRTLFFCFLSSSFLFASGCIERESSTPDPTSGVAPTDEQGITCRQDVDPERELIIRALPVVEDPLRTIWRGDLADPRDGAWAWGRLISDLSGDRDPAEVMRRWLELWKKPETINGSSTGARPDVERMIRAWPKLDDGRFDLERSPFRLLAIVFRVDLRRRNSKATGEGRLIFGLTGESDSDPSAEALPFTAILEYNLPTSDDGPRDARDWARDVHALGAIPIDDPHYNEALQSLTDRFTRRNLAPDAPNGSALAQLRTNERELFVGEVGSEDDDWQLRQFELDKETGLFVAASIADTPDARFDGSPELGEFLQENANRIREGDHQVPLTFRGLPFRGASIFASEPRWTSPGSDPELSADFALFTCNGCHRTATDANFTHVAPRKPGEISKLSSFLTGIEVRDRARGTVRSFDELALRARDLAGLACGP